MDILFSLINSNTTILAGKVAYSETHGHGIFTNINKVSIMALWFDSVLIMETMHTLIISHHTKKNLFVARCAVHGLFSCKYLISMHKYNSICWHLSCKSSYVGLHAVRLLYADGLLQPICYKNYTKYIDYYCTSWQ